MFYLGIMCMKPTMSDARKAVDEKRAIEIAPVVPCALPGASAT
jgi:hypothetical protein